MTKEAKRFFLIILLLGVFSITIAFYRYFLKADFKVLNQPEVKEVGVTNLNDLTQ